MAQQARGVCLIPVEPSLDDTNTDIDIIALHGLDTKSPETWTYQLKGKDKGVNWLLDSKMLPSNVGQARIFTCDWPADLIQKSDNILMTLNECAVLLLADIHGTRLDIPKTNRGRKDRPIIFIASCLGGIILMKALVTANNPQNQYFPIKRATRGIVFLATPFRGTSFQDVANWAVPFLKTWALIRGKALTTLLDSVKGCTEDLEILVRDFTGLFKNPEYRCEVHSFYEKDPTSFQRKVFRITIPLLSRRKTVSFT